MIAGCAPHTMTTLTPTMTTGMGTMTAGSTLPAASGARGD